MKWKGRRHQACHIFLIFGDVPACMPFVPSACRCRRRRRHIGASHRRLRRRCRRAPSPGRHACRTRSSAAAEPTTSAPCPIPRWPAGRHSALRCRPTRRQRCCRQTRPWARQQIRRSRRRHRRRRRRGWQAAKVRRRRGRLPCRDPLLPPQPCRHRRHLRRLVACLRRPYSFARTSLEEGCGAIDCSQQVRMTALDSRQRVSPSCIAQACERSHMHVKAPSADRSSLGSNTAT